MTKVLKDKRQIRVSASRSCSIKKTEKQDETDYLMSNPANKKFIEESIEQVKAGKVRRVKLFRL